mgnify:CR=1 FL=1
MPLAALLSQGCEVDLVVSDFGRRLLRDELGVLPPGDVLRCALALAPNEAEARRVLLELLEDHFALGLNVCADQVVIDNVQDDQLGVVVLRQGNGAADSGGYRYGHA